jgi:CRISPR-associated endonuclease/helicase Cas3
MAEIMLAKSEPQISLKQHTEDGLEVWKHLQISFPLASKIAQKENFWWLLRLAVITHDLGKSHQEFQKILRGEDNKWLKQRHELFSLPFTAQLPLNDLDKKYVMRVVAGHHRSYEWLKCHIPDFYNDDIEEFFEEFAKVNMTAAVKIANELEEKILPDSILPIDVERIIIDFKREVNRIGKNSAADYSTFFTQLLMMGAFHQCDHLSSGFVTSFPNLENKHFEFLEAMRRELILKGFNFYSHQQKAIKTIGNVILTAPTGSGKTETAMLWLRHQLAEIGQGRTFYILPFTASINAMFERLGNQKEGLGQDMVGMLHGKVNAYLYENFFGETGDLTVLKTKIKSVKEQFKNLETPLKVSTPFQLLKHLFGIKGFEKGIFEWTGGHFIFDEIHAYDPKVTAQNIILLEFLTERMEANIFIMTATLPTFLKNKIKKAIGNNLSEIKADETLYSSFQRHKLKIEEGLLSESFDKIERRLKAKYNVLIVCNTVDSSRLVFNHFKDEYESLLIHGRFAAKDRNKIEKDLREKPPQLLVGTQAIEVSLDIDYDVIFTEPAPLDALIQRFGRVNRKRSKDPCDCIVFRERNEIDKYIYEDDLIGRTLGVLVEIEAKNNGVIQEIELQKYIDLVYPNFSEEAQREFDEVYINLKSHVNRLFPFDPSKEGEEAFYKQFDGVKVVPAFYENSYRRLLEDFDFIGAEQLKVSLRSSRFSRYFNTPALENLEITVANPNRTDSQPITLNYFKLNKNYESDTGLDFDVDAKPDADSHIF